MRLGDPQGGAHQRGIEKENRGLQQARGELDEIQPSRSHRVGQEAAQLVGFVHLGGDQITQNRPSRKKNRPMLKAIHTGF